MNANPEVTTYTFNDIDNMDKSLVDSLNKLGEIKPMPRNILLSYAFEYNLEFKWYHTKGYIRQVIKCHIEQDYSNFESYRHYVVRLIFG